VVVGLDESVALLDVRLGHGVPVSRSAGTS
jgi:hypothetical protein